NPVRDLKLVLATSPRRCRIPVFRRIESCGECGRWPCAGRPESTTHEAIREFRKSATGPQPRRRLPGLRLRRVRSRQKGGSGWPRSCPNPTGTPFQLRGLRQEAYASINNFSFECRFEESSFDLPVEADK